MSNNHVAVNSKKNVIKYKLRFSTLEYRYYTYIHTKYTCIQKFNIERREETRLNTRIS